MTGLGTDTVTDTVPSHVTGLGMVLERGGGHPGHVTGHLLIVTGPLVPGVIVQGVLTEEQGRQRFVTELLNLVKEVYLVRGLHGHSPMRGPGHLCAVTDPLLCHGITASPGKHLWINEVSGLCLEIMTGARLKTGSDPHLL